MLLDHEIPIASTAIREFRVALSNLFLYSTANTMVDQSLSRFIQALEQLMGDREEITMGVSEGRLVLDGSALDEKVTGSTAMIRELFTTHELHALTFRKGMGTEELRIFGSLLKPRALPPGTTLAQALQVNPLEHLSLNLKVFVAMGEGEAASMGEGGEGAETGLSEAMEALHYFLQVFSKVKPDTNKKEIVRLLGEQVGDLYPAGEGVGMGGMGTGGGVGAGEGSGIGGLGDGASSKLGSIVTALEGLRQMLSTVDLPPAVVRESTALGESIQRLVQAVSEKLETVAEGEMVSAPEETGSQEALFETDPIMAAVEAGDLKVFRDPRQEEKVARFLRDLQTNPRMEITETVWEGLWQVLQAPDEGTQALGLRHLNRWKWENLPRHLQVEGLRNLREYLLRCAGPVPYQIALLLSLGWLMNEWKRPDWPAFNAFIRTLASFDRIPAESFPDQRQKARTMFQGLWNKEQMEELFRRTTGEASDARGSVETWSALGAFAGPFLLEKALGTHSKDGSQAQALWILERLEFSGLEMLDGWLGQGTKPSRLMAFLSIYDRMILTATVARKLRGWWDSFDAAEKTACLTAASKWGRREFREPALKMIHGSTLAESIWVMGIYPEIAQTGDAREILRALEERSFDEKSDKERFSLSVCECLGRLADTLAVPVLEEWIQPKGLIEKFKERNIDIRRAALQALGQYRSRQVRSFLEKIAEHGDKDLRPAAQEALNRVSDRLAAE